ncbi:sensor histidine kinase [Leptolyngbya sp. AN02str]|uniref:sensor histidine kinase n=1 Tax=Leptolyngbya sp. AN02str TaxID=3423363 RepID=UPI003D31F363
MAPIHPADDDSQSDSPAAVPQPVPPLLSVFANMDGDVEFARSQFELLLMASMDAIALCGGSGQFLAVNQATCQLFNLPLSALQQHEVNHFLPEDSALRTCWNLTPPAQRFTGETQIRRLDGGVRDVEFVAIAHWVSHCHVLILRDLTEQRKAETDYLIVQEAVEWEQQAREREQFIANIAQTIRQSLNLADILNATVRMVQQFLAVERVLIFQFQPDGSGQVVAEAVSAGIPSIRDRTICDPCFQGPRLQPYEQGQIHRVNDVLNADLEACYIELLTSLDVRAILAIPILVRQELWGLLVAHECTRPRHWEEVNWLLLQQLSTQIAIGIHQASLYQHIEQQAQREQLLNRINQVLRSRLDLDALFAVAVEEIGRQLKLSRVEIVRYMPREAIWMNVASYRRSSDLPNAFGLVIPDENNSIAVRLRQLEVVQVHHYSAEADEVNRSLADTYDGAWLHVPLPGRHGPSGRSPEVWGSLSLCAVSYPHQWKSWEVELACRIADQLAIAIQQSEQFASSTQLNTALEYQVQVRTEQLQQALEFEALLKRIAENVRDSLNEADILQAVVSELSQRLEIAGCEVSLYDHHQQVSTIRYERLLDPELQSAQDRVIPFQAIAHRMRQYEQNITFQFCSLYSEPVRTISRMFSVLACPIMGDQQVLGDIWLMRRCEAAFSPAEIRLVEQVANQCAIALRQAHLYQAAQAQVQELERLNRLKDDFLSTVSHELRTPMASIKMATQMLEHVLVSPRYSNQAPEQTTQPGRWLDAETVQRISQYLQVLHEECQRETQLINNLLDLSRLDADVEPLMPTEINLALWIPHVLEVFRELIQTRSHTLRVDIPTTLPAIYTDLAYLERILSELINNACKYSPPGETISLTAATLSQTPLTFCLTVVNSGVEIPPSERDRIFEKFYRIPSNDPWKYEGTGLGLALVKKLVANLGGNIQVESGNNLTQFMVRLPNL